MRQFKVGDKVKCKFGTRKNGIVHMVMTQVEHYEFNKQCLVDFFDGAEPYMFFTNDDNLVLDDWKDEDKIDVND